jgi:putative transcriptional regulator
MGRAEGKWEKTRKRPKDGGAFAIYNRVRVLRQEMGLSQRELAEALGINYRTVGYLERQDYEPSLRLAYQIADFFGVPLGAVFSREPFARMSEELYGRGER